MSLNNKENKKLKEDKDKLITNFDLCISGGCSGCSIFLLILVGSFTNGTFIFIFMYINNVKKFFTHDIGRDKMSRFS